MEPTNVLKDIYASVKAEFIIPKDVLKTKNDTSASSVHNPLSSDPSSTKTLKKRHFESYPAKENRLCSFVIKEDTCPYGSSCQYSHDPFEYLSTKGIIY